ncbi:hypothetical protein ABT127_19215 [Streptomyces sp. NPDC001904]
MARLVAGETETRAQFEAEPTACRCDNKGTKVWSARASVDTVARA